MNRYRSTRSTAVTVLVCISMLIAVAPALAQTRPSVAAGQHHTVGLTVDGTATATGYAAATHVDGWSGLVAVSGGNGHTVGLRADGTVVAIGENDRGQCNVADWAGITAISADDYHTVGLKRDRTVVATGSNDWGQCDVGAWRNIVAVATGSAHTLGLTSDGTVVAVGFSPGGRLDVGSWSGIVALAGGGSHSVGLRADGTVVAVGSNSMGQCDVGDWRGIVAIAAGGDHTVGLRWDGTLVETGKNDYGQCDVHYWKGVVAIAAGGVHTVGLRSDGKVLATGDTSFGACNVSAWRLGSVTTVDLSASPANPAYGGSSKLSATVRAGATIPLLGQLVVFERWDGKGWIRSGTATSNVDGLAARTVSGLKTRQIYRARLESSPDATSTPAVLLPKVRLTRTTSWRTLYRYRTYVARGYIEPYHSTRDGNRVVIRAYQLQGGRYRLMKSFPATYVYSSRAKTAYKASVRFTARGAVGNWMLVAYHATDKGNYATLGSPDYVQVR